MSNAPHFSTGTKKVLARYGAAAALALMCLCGVGCSTQTSMRYSPAAVAAMSPVAEVVQPFAAVEKGRAFVAAHPGSEYLVGSGDSMLPLYKDHTVVVVQKSTISDLKAGMTVVYLNDAGRPVAHVLVAKNSDGWIAMGVGNAACDATPVTGDNLIGVVVRAYQPSTSPMLALLRESSVTAMVASMP